MKNKCKKARERFNRNFTKAATKKGELFINMLYSHQYLSPKFCKMFKHCMKARFLNIPQRKFSKSDMVTYWLPTTEKWLFSGFQMSFSLFLI